LVGCLLLIVALISFDNHKAMIALHDMHYNAGRIHTPLRVTPAMEAGVSGHVRSLEEIAGLAESARTGRPRWTKVY
jgi:hypothetical protein